MGVTDPSRLAWDARDALARAHSIAGGPIGLRHLLFGLVTTSNSYALLVECGVDLAPVSAEIADLKPVDRPVLPKDFVCTDEAAEALRHAAAHDGPIRTWDLISGLIRQGGLAELAGLAPESPMNANDRIWARITDPTAIWGGRTEPAKDIVPAEIREFTARILQARQRKEEAIDAEDFGLAGMMRDVEKRLLAERAECAREWIATVDVLALVDEVERLRAEVAGLRSAEGA
ncbi:hypothetical protein Lesp02_80090 [Lentzea sp. NBRC 105346]|uniref:hypothetical protein n=1 Tax=Lentzea sp. NBRC 105346 TaxID=3032205 RepID=UPI0024A1E0B6|nr:hypothetical protein [Lentzea sp. NBRC 105346]GLZ35822.1 hypothetical protein Lesp02_80090 [Lentzea sp. NBRC 105346]